MRLTPEERKAMRTFYGSDALDEAKKIIRLLKLELANRTELVERGLKRIAELEAEVVKAKAAIRIAQTSKGYHP